MARKNLSFALLALMAITVHAQHFEWAKNFYGYGDKYVNFPCGLVADSEGNVYHLMQVASGGTLDNIDPFEVVTNYNPSALLVKMSPDGQYLWHRIINPHERDNESAITVHDLRMLGDTALMMMVNIPLPYTEIEYGHPIVYTALYYLDTLLTTSELLMPTDSIYHWGITAFITLGLDGTLKEQHFLQVTYLDSLGHPVMSGGRVYGNGLSTEHFDVDSRGNIYVIRLAQDCAAFSDVVNPLYFNDGGLSGYRFMVDGTRFLTHIPQYTTSWWNQQVLKFSPHFDSLLDASYIAGVAPWVESFNTNPLSIRSFDIHDDDQIYITFNTKIEHSGIPIARSNGLQIETDSLSWAFGSDCMLRLDTALNANLLMQFDYVPHSDGGYSSVFLSATCVDTATGSLFVLGTAGTDSWGGNSNPHQFIYRGDTLDNRNSTFWLRVDNDGGFLSYGHINSDRGGNDGGMGIVARDNRVFAQLDYTGNIQFAGSTFSTPNASQRGLALAQWDYDGHEVAIHDFHCNHGDSSPGHMLLRDTSLYITGNSFSSPTTFGDIACGMGQYIAKLTDTSMGSPYVYDTTSHGGEVSITLVEDKVALVAYPNPFRQSVRIKVESGQLKEHNGTVTAILTDMMGRREEVRLTPTGDGQYSLDLTSHPQATYLLTLTTADGRHHTVKLLKL